MDLLVISLKAIDLNLMHDASRMSFFLITPIPSSPVIHHFIIKKKKRRNDIKVLSLSFEENLPCGDLCGVTGVQDATGCKGVGGEGGALALSWILD